MAKSARVKRPSLEDLKAERDRFMVTKENPERLEEIIKHIDFIEYGIT